MKKTGKFKKIFAVLMIALTVLTVSVLPAFAVTPEAHTEEVNVFERIFSAVSSNLSEILCTLTLAGSIVLAIAYKKGLLPLVRGAVSAIGKGIGKLESEAESFNKTSGEHIGAISEKLDKAAKVIDGFADRLGALEAELAKISKSSERFAVIQKAVETEAELLYDVFMSSALPEYQKDAVSKRIAEINETLKEG